MPLKAQADHMKQGTVSTASQLLTAITSSASVERLFSLFGLVQSNLDNHLGNERAEKLAFLFKLMIKKPAKGTDERHLLNRLTNERTVTRV